MLADERLAVSTRVMPGFFAAKLSSIMPIARAWSTPSGSFAAIWLISPKNVSSMNSISPSYIWALLAKCR